MGLSICPGDAILVVGATKRGVTESRGINHHGICIVLPLCSAEPRRWCIWIHTPPLSPFVSHLHFFPEGSFGCHHILYPKCQISNANVVVPIYRNILSLRPVHLSVGTYLLVVRLWVCCFIYTYKSQPELWNANLKLEGPQVGSMPLESLSVFRSVELYPPGIWFYSLSHEPFCSLLESLLLWTFIANLATTASISRTHSFI